MAAAATVEAADMRDDVAFQVDFERAAPRYRQLPAPVKRILKLCDGTRGLSQLVAMSPIDPERTEAVLRRLAQLGIIAPCAKEPQEPKAPPKEKEKEARPAGQVLAFSSDEEQFFESSIDHLVVDEFAE
jgi:hypothetical protein